MSFFDNFSDPQKGLIHPSTTQTAPPDIGYGPTPIRRNLRLNSPPGAISISTDINMSVFDDWSVEWAGGPPGPFPAFPAPTSGITNSIINLRYQFLVPADSTTSITLFVDPSITPLIGLPIDVILTLNGVSQGPGVKDFIGDNITWTFPPTIPAGFMYFDIVLDQTLESVPSFAAAFLLVTAALPCLAKDSMILMADGTYKPIQDIVRGDLVAADSHLNKIHTVARLNINKLDEHFPSDIVTFEPHSLGSNQPSKKLIISANHPLCWEGKRRPAKCFANLPNINRYYKGQILKKGIPFDETRTGPITLKGLLPPNSDGTYNLYDLQFETLGSYVANGVPVQSRSPRSDITPLPKNLYFDQSLYREDVGADDEEYEFQLDFTEVTNLN